MQYKIELIRCYDNFRNNLGYVTGKLFRRLEFVLNIHK